MIRPCAWCGTFSVGFPQSGGRVVRQSICLQCFDELLAECGGGLDSSAEGMDFEDRAMLHEQRYKKHQPAWGVG
jgi:hypothetical protein